MCRLTDFYRNRMRCRLCDAAPPYLHRELRRLGVMPLAFIEVKKPNNREGVLAERNRIITRSRNPRFRRFINITQLMVFSNNMEYDDGSPQPIEGAFYASPSYDAPAFNYFREEEALDLTTLLADEDDTLENEVLRDNNLNVIKHSPEFLSNKSPNAPTNRICTSLFSRDRLAFLLRFSLVYVNETDGLQKHVMRYPQLFATKAIARKLDAGVKKGIIWHTQGSGKTALAYYNTRFLTDYFQRQATIPKFYFIVDRLDLLIQAQREFAGRGLVVHTIDSREAFARDIKTTQVLHNHAGKPEITVVNIQKFQDDPDVVRAEDYDVCIQRVYFLDEVHRSYNPQGSFLANLILLDAEQLMPDDGRPESYAARTLLKNRAKTAALILHDVGSKDERKQWVEDFKAGKIDLLFVYNMLLTGFDAKRLKKLYLGRVIRSHNLLQALTRVNRTYKDFRYGYVVDFADIRKEFDATNKAYFDELQAELGDEIEHYSNLFKSAEEIAQEIEAIKDTGTSNSHKRVNPNVMMRFDLPYQKQIAEKFGEIVSPLLNKLIANQRESVQLAQLRDWLLPLLMNGQIAVA